ncbi:hypothetical protein ACVMH6_007301 [Rhizobium leguminosarum]
MKPIIYGAIFTIAISFRALALVSDIIGNG